jgi:hypothetical protein
MEACRACELLVSIETEDGFCRVRCAWRARLGAPEQAALLRLRDAGR